MGLGGLATIEKAREERTMRPLWASRNQRVQQLQVSCCQLSQFSEDLSRWSSWGTWEGSSEAYV